MAKISPLWRNMLLYIMSAIIITVLFSSGACVLYINRVLTRSAEAAFEDLSENLVYRSFLWKQSKSAQFFPETIYLSMPCYKLAKIILWKSNMTITLS